MSERTLVLLRHASAEASALGGDSQRALTATGRAQAEHTARELVDRGVVAERVLCSTAVRARETWDLVRGVSTLFGAAVSAFDPALYLAPPALLLQAIAGLDDAVRCAYVIGHNPGLEQLAQRLAQESGRRAADGQRGMSPATAVVLRSPEAWARWPKARAELAFVVRPCAG